MNSFELKQIQQLLSLLFNLLVVRDTEYLSIEKFILDLITTIELNFKLNQANKEFLFKLIDEENNFSLQVKSTRLIHEHSNVLQNTRIITDVRPVFNNSKNEINSNLITHTLKIRRF